MAEHYEVFYCLEKSIRKLISELMEEKYGENWWDSQVKEAIKNNVESNIKRDEDSGFTIRSENNIDYTFIDVDLDEEATKKVESINNGKRIIPTIRIRPQTTFVPYTPAPNCSESHPIT